MTPFVTDSLLLLAVLAMIAIGFLAEAAQLWLNRRKALRRLRWHRRHAAHFEGARFPWSEGKRGQP